MEPRTHYQISLTSRQAVGAFVGLLLALGLAFFFGLMTGLSGRGRANAKGSEPAETLAEARPAGDALPPVETAVPAPARGEARGESARTSESGGPVQALAASSAAEPTPPQTLETFEDGGAEEPTSATPSAASLSAPTPHAGAGAKSPPPAPPSAGAGRVWVQVASVSSRNEAESVSSRLSKRGYHAVVSAEKGRLRVRVGPYRTTEEARRAAEKLRKQEKVKSPWVVFEGK